MDGILNQGISKKVFFTSFSIFLILLVSIFGLSYGQYFFLYAYIVIATPIIFFLFYLRGVNGGVSKKVIFSPIIIATAALAYLFIRLFSIKDTLVKAGEGTGASIFWLGFEVVLDPQKWFLGLILTVFFVWVFFKVTLSEKSAGVSGVIPESKFSSAVGVSSDPAMTFSSNETLKENDQDVGRIYHPMLVLLLIIFFFIILVVVEHTIASGISIFIPIYFVISFIVLGIYGYKNKRSVFSIIFIPCIFTVLYLFLVFLIQQVPISAYNEFTETWTMLYTEPHRMGISDLMVRIGAFLFPNLEKPYHEPFASHWYLNITLLAVLLILLIIQTNICLKRRKI